MVPVDPPGVTEPWTCAVAQWTLGAWLKTSGMARRRKPVGPSDGVHLSSTLAVGRSLLEGFARQLDLTSAHFRENRPRSVADLEARDARWRIRASTTSPEELRVKELSDSDEVGLAVGEIAVTVVEPRSVNDAHVIGDHLRNGQVVLLDLRKVDQTQGKRLIDFSAGVVFGLQGTIEVFGERIYLVRPGSMPLEVAQALVEASPEAEPILQELKAQ